MRTEVKQTSYAFLSVLIPEVMKDEVASLSCNNMSEAANALQWHLYNGLCENLNTEITLLNILPIGSYPQYYKKVFIKKSLFTTPYCLENINIGFCNIKLLRKYLQPKKVYSALNNWCQTHAGKKVLFVYTIAAMFVTTITRIKTEHPDLKVCAIVADLPDMTSLRTNKSFLQKLMESRMSYQSYSSLDSIDAFVLLTKQMAEYMKIKQPFCVIEGISTYITETESGVTDSGHKVIMYTGTLHRKFGILNLLNAFYKIKGKEYRLVICGIGDSEESIKLASARDKRIEYKGQLSREEVLKLQKNATVLVNPRQNNEEFTKYSFPSKNLEYLSSGKPLIAYKLDGIPDEYDDYIYYVPDNTVESFANTLIKVCEMDKVKRDQRAYKAKQFVLQEKNEMKQTKRIIDFLKRRGIINGW